MPTAAVLRAQIEAALAHRIPSALTPVPRSIRPTAATGIREIDALLDGGLPLGAVTEVVGAECSGRTSLALSYVAGMTRDGKVCAWVDVSDAFQPESAAAAGMVLRRLLWVRCGVQAEPASLPRSEGGFALPEKYLTPPPIKKGLHGGGFGPHPRTEIKGMSDAVGSFLHPEGTTARHVESRPRAKLESGPAQAGQRFDRPAAQRKPWSRIDQALRVTDLLLQAGGFSAIVLDMGSLAPEHVSRVPLATWFRYRAAAEQTQASLLLLTQHASAKSSAELVLRLQPGEDLHEEATVFAGVGCSVEIARDRFTRTESNVLPLRKPPQRETAARWRSKPAWTGKR